MVNILQLLSYCLLRIIIIKTVFNTYKNFDYDIVIGMQYELNHFKSDVNQLKIQFFRKRYDTLALTLHEANPGHNLQVK
jgi:hypothetical protein